MASGWDEDGGGGWWVYGGGWIGGRRRKRKKKDRTAEGWQRKVLGLGDTDGGPEGRKDGLTYLNVSSRETKTTPANLRNRCAVASLQAHPYRCSPKSWKVSRGDGYARVYPAHAQPDATVR